MRRTINPALSTWIIFSVATILGAASLLADTKDLVGAVLPVADVISCTAIALAVVILNGSFILKPFEKYYLLASLGLVFFWIISKNPFVTNLLVQLLIAFGYVPTVHKTVETGRHSEPVLSWIFSMMAGVASVFVAWPKGEILPIVYSFRTVFMVLGLLIFLSRYPRVEVTERSADILPKALQ